MFVTARYGPFHNTHDVFQRRLQPPISCLFAPLCLLLLVITLIPPQLLVAAHHCHVHSPPSHRLTFAHALPIPFSGVFACAWGVGGLGTLWLGGVIKMSLVFRRPFEMTHMIMMSRSSQVAQSTLAQGSVKHFPVIPLCVMRCHDTLHLAFTHHCSDVQTDEATLKFPTCVTTYPCRSSSKAVVSG